MSGFIHSCHAAKLLTQQNVRSEHTLATPGPDELVTESRPDNSAVCNKVCCVSLLGSSLKNGDRRIRVPVRLSDQADERICKCLWDLGEIHGLQTVTCLLQW